jgi:hypothetical protein
MRRLSTLLVALLAIACACAVPVSAVEMPTFGKAWCKGSPVRDYRAPLDALPTVQHPPEQLPFGPRNLNLYARSFSPVIVGEGGFGYGFFDETYRNRTLRLNWEMTARISRVNNRGEVLRMVKKRTLRLEEVSHPDEIDLWLKVPAGPALYRYDLEFHDLQSGELLGSYSEYLRVVRRGFHARIAVNRRTFRPGQTAYARVENPGTEGVFFGVDYDVQRFESGRWVHDPAGPSGGWILIGLTMGGGGSGWCMQFHIPTLADAGWYRFIKDLAPASRFRHEHLYTAAFRVTGR